MNRHFNGKLNALAEAAAMNEAVSSYESAVEYSTRETSNESRRSLNYRGELAHARTLLADLLYEKQQFTEANDQLTKAAKEFNKNGNSFRHQNFYLDALEAFHRVAEVFARLSTGSPDVPLHPKEWANALNNQAELQSVLKRYEDSLVLFQKARSVYEDAIKKIDWTNQTDDLRNEFDHGLAGAISNIGFVNLQLKDSDKALSHVNEAITLSSTVVKRAPDNLEFRGFYCRQLLLRSMVLAHARDVEGSRHSLDEALRQSERAWMQLQEESPINISDQRNVGAILVAVGQEIIDHESFDEVDCFSKAVGVYELIVKGGGEERDIIALCGAYRNQLGVLLIKDEVEKASEVANKSITLQEKLLENHPDDTELRDELSLTRTHLVTILLSLRRIDDAIDEVKKIQELWPRHWSSRFGPARRFAIAALSTNESATRRRCMDIAIQLLRDAGSLGFAHYDELEKDDAFAMLRADPRYPEIAQVIRKQSEADRAIKSESIKSESMLRKQP